MEDRNRKQEPCPLCENDKLLGYAVCAKHKSIYNAEAASIIYNGVTPPTYEEWLIPKLEEAIPNLQKQVVQARKEHLTAAELYDQFINDKVREKKSGQILEEDLLKALRQEIIKHDGLTLKKLSGEPTAYYNMRRAERQLSSAQRLLQDLRRKTQIIQTQPQPL